MIKNEQKLEFGNEELESFLNKNTKSVLKLGFPELKASVDYLNSIKNKIYHEAQKLQKEKEDIKKKIDLHFKKFENSFHSSSSETFIL